MRKYILVVCCFVLISLSFTKDDQYFEISKNLDIFSTLYKELNTYYVDDIQASEIMRTGIDAMLSSLDPYTQFISEAEIEDFRFQTTGKYGGIGALIGKMGSYVVITEPYENSPANKAGLLAGDKLVSIDGKDVISKTTDDVSKLLKGQPGSKVELKVRRLLSNGSETDMVISLVREEIHINNVSYYGLVDNEIGLIQLEHFTQDAGKEVKEALETLKSKNKLNGVILDLRGNPGGLLNEAVNVANVFVDKGEEIVSTRGKVDEWDRTFKSINPVTDNNIPLIVLTNSGSASAAEIVSGSIQDLDRGVIIGQRTFGKGLVQTTRSLSYNTKLKVTTAKYYIPSGRCIQAINYAEKGPEGEVKKIPDSLKVAFKTRSGRVVYDGGGIDPDVPTDELTLSKIAESLVTKNLIFDFATMYRSKHNTINSAKEFTISNQDFEEFAKFIADKDYSYSTQSESILKELEAVTVEEKYFDAVNNDLKILAKKIETDKGKDVFKQKEEIISLINEEISERYYLRKGRIEASFKNDPDIIKAVNIFKNVNDYNKILNKK